MTRNFMTPIFKKAAKNVIENYRPIMLTSISCRLLENIIKDKITNHLTKEKLLFSNQHVNGRSTVNELFHFLDSAGEAIAEGEVVDVCHIL